MIQHSLRLDIDDSLVEARRDRRYEVSVAKTESFVNSPEREKECVL
jgi:hypothetical protein